jgi:hypothetical protein
MSLENPTLPTIHLNGTGAMSLYQEYSDFRMAINAASDRLSETTCNARDFYPQGPIAYTNAQSERREARHLLTDLGDFAQAWMDRARPHLWTTPTALEPPVKRPPPEQELLLRIYLLLREYNAEINCYNEAWWITVGGVNSEEIFHPYLLRDYLIEYGLLPSEDPEEPQP